MGEAFSQQSAMSNQHEAYSRLTDDQLLNLGSEQDSLRPESRMALLAELGRRGFDAQDVQKQAEEIRRHTLEAKRRKPLARTFNGFGTTTYGKRDFQPKAQADRPRGLSRRYLVLCDSSPNIAQVASIYLYVASLLAIGWVLDFIHLGSPEAESVAASVAIALWIAAPWALRRRSRSLVWRL